MDMIYVPAFILLFLICFCKSDDRLTPTKPLSPGDRLISDGGIFALGFFSLKNSSANSYVGIWYNQIPERTYVWVANRDSPITSSSSDSKGSTLWTTSNNITSEAAGTAAILLDTGNLVIRLSNGTDIWQSFHYPTDTLLPNMTTPLSSKNKLYRPFVAWRGPDDLSTGDYSSGSDSSLVPQVFIWNGTRPYWRRAAWTGALVNNVYQRNTGAFMFETIERRGAEFYITYTVSNGSPNMLAKLHYTGMVKVLTWNSKSSSWDVFMEYPSHGCDSYASCGPFGYCDGTEAIPTCKCLDGFESAGLNYSLGCQRKKELKCDGTDSFITLSGMKTPDKFLYIRNRSFDQCAEECRSNCSCNAYAYANLSSLGSLDTVGDSSRCLVWMGELVDTGKPASGASENLYLRISSSSSKRPRKGQNTHMLKHLNAYKLGNEDTELPSVDFDEILTATNNFSDYNMLGKGGFGKVYKGILEDGMEVAVKRLSMGSGQGIEEFKNEVVLIAKLQHRNLARLLGYCIHEDEKLLIYEYLPNRSLDAFLFGIARGLLYLHQDSRLTIIHRDLKASNILLDAQMSPKISDFGMARIFGGNEQQANTNRVVGTYGYMSPEYAMEGYFSVKSDTYSFGVLLLEIVSGLRISSPHLTMDFPNLIAYAWSLWVDGNARELVDRSVVESCPLDEVLRCVHIGLLCVQDHSNARPPMSSIVFMLENETALLPAPKKPTYFSLRNHEAEDWRKYMGRSENNMSITTLEGR
ncbi:G-type lectin S-receptor-like serine/threonine-protein kinase B120 [Triticum dicoccoides]|uniref:G-type lectin S-receptor-like serine/threonine-protein kinase B120 n=1 Tax=Triticum dicoccoides TaxID=85692 RepID=UPI00189053F7|nr:G-type lectin S-receptor-like serine/threonine-protein kinase B120 [Triticum dicoccoides]